MESEGGGEEEKQRVIFRDIRRYYCDYCGICRSKKSLIAAHLLANHKDEMEEKEVDCGKGKETVEKKNICEECGASFRKPAYLKQHMRGHMLEWMIVARATEGKIILPDTYFSIKQESSFLAQCQTARVVKLDTIEAVCCEPDCMKVFTNGECLKAHIQACHQHITCDICGIKQPKKNVKRHMQVHEGGVASNERIKCSYEGCQYTFATKSNLNQHVKAVHLELRPFVCRIGGCGKKFSYRHVRDNHEKSHEYVQGDFLESDAQFQSRTSRGGRKRKLTSTIEMLQRKRIVPPGLTDSAFEEPSDYVAWLLSSTEDQQ
ncbi:hypothetical protein Sjap_012190 [Stephania japonica]|uniref:C2H2-type domain-containing protein n=1 Tax=Stephania japonica TaxID=461633 RepID=A0AAP0NXC9_9MAGN